MLISAIIPIGDVKRDFDNLLSIAKSVNELNFELIYVFDSQSDSDLVAELKREISQIIENRVFLNVQFQNPGETRNIGIVHATGEYIVFWDSDDLPIPHQIIQIANRMTKLNIEISICSYFSIGEDFSSELKIIKKMDDIAYNPGIWRWVFKSEIARKFKFPPLRWGEDQCYLAAQLSSQLEPKIYFEPIYIYKNNRHGSLTKDRTNVVDLLNAIDLVSSNISLNFRNSCIQKTMKCRLIYTGIFKSNFYIKKKFIKLGIVNFLNNPILMIKTAIGVLK